MKIANLSDGQLVIDDYWTLFPQTSFSADGPNAEFFAEHGCYTVTAFKSHDSASQMLVNCEPYLEDGVVYTVRVDARPEPTIEIIVASDNGADTI
jgi:hypothetical protein